MKKHFKDYINKLKKGLDSVELNQVEAITNTLYRAYKNRRQIFIMGNGGSAAIASHFACDLSKNVMAKDKPRFRAISLTDNVPLMTALSNDLAYKYVFVEQLRYLLRPNDIVICISGSGDSPNIIEAIKYAKQNNIHTIGMLGFGGGMAKGMVDQYLHVESHHYGRTEDIHLAVEHMICDLLNIKINMHNKAVIFDRDGVINKSPGENKFITKWGEFEFIPGAAKAIRALNKQGYLVFIATNQSCVAKRFVSKQAVNKINERMRKELEKSGAHIDDVFCCPHRAEDDCECRKPKPGMLLRIAGKYNIDLAEAWVIGDSKRDIEAGNAVGCKTIFLSDHDLVKGKKEKIKIDFVTTDILTAVKIIKKVDKNAC